MPVYLLPDEPLFPDPEMAQQDGLIAVGGDLSTTRLVTAYSLGIFPWYDKGLPILWWCPDPRLILEPSNLHVTRRLARTVRQGVFEISLDRDFDSVITKCAQIPRTLGPGTWITDEMIGAYIGLHKLGIAHSVESYLNGELVGGLYGIAIGKAFFGESMFHHERDASKVAFASLVGRLVEKQYHLIDAQQKTRHMKSLGASLMSREKFIELLQKAITFETESGPWNT